MSYALVDIADAPRIIDVYNTLAEALVSRDINYAYYGLHTFRLVTANGIQQLGGDELRREKAARNAIHERLAEQRKAQREAEERNLRERFAE